MSPNSEIMEAQEIIPIPGIESVGGLRSLIIVESCLSIESILESISS